MKPSKTVTLRDGTVASLPVLQCLWAIEARGGTFTPIEGGKIRVEPSNSITFSELSFLRTHREEARRLIEYRADDSHLTDATVPAIAVFAQA